MEWVEGKGTVGGHYLPTATLKDGDQPIAKIYLSPDGKVLRIVLPEFNTLNQLKVDVANHLLDFRRS